MNKTTAAIIIVLCACIIYFERALPWLAFGKKEMPPMVKRLSDLLPPALMAILVVYGLKGLTTSDAHTVIAMIVASIFTAIIHIYKKNQILSVFLGTALYMILLNCF
jgi:branched-subunit amino acid transport protein AzlD